MRYVYKCINQVQLLLERKTYLKDPTTEKVFLQAEQENSCLIVQCVII